MTSDILTQVWRQERSLREAFHCCIGTPPQLQALHRGEPSDHLQLVYSPDCIGWVPSHLRTQSISQKGTPGLKNHTLSATTSQVLWFGAGVRHICNHQSGVVVRCWCSPRLQPLSGRPPLTVLWFGVGDTTSATTRGKPFPS